MAWASGVRRLNSNTCCLSSQGIALSGLLLEFLLMRPEGIVVAI